MISNKPLTLTERTGDYMPGSSYDPKEYPIQREIRVYEYTTINDFPNGFLVESDIDSIQTTFIGKTTTDEEGFSEIALQPGKYSIFTIENNKLYALGGDSYDGIQPVTISENETIKYNLVVDNNVVY